MNTMTNEQLAHTLRKASESIEDNIALKILLLMAAERLEQQA